MSNSFTQVFGGTTIYPADVSYLALALTGNISLEWPLEATAGSSVVARIIDITPSGAYTITMPEATSVSVGQTVLFNNIGPSTVAVNKANGSAILSIGAGEQWQAYLIDNTTPGGTWRTLRYGAATAQAQAAALAGPGLVTDGSQLAQNYEVIDFSVTPYTLTAPDRAKVFIWDGGLGTLNLPSAPAAGDGWFVQVRNAGQGDLTVDPSGSELINAGSTLLLQPGDSAVVVSNGTQWYTIGLGQQAVFAFDYTSIAVTGGTYTLTGSELNRIAYKFTGALASNVTIVVPATVQQYWVNNSTTGPFTLSLQASGSGSSTPVTQSSTSILYCDGTAIVPATTAVTFAGILPVSQGGTGANNAPSARTNLGATGIGSSLFTATSAASARSTISAASSGANSDITSLSGLTTPLSVGQGGTGAATLTANGVVVGNGTSAVQVTAAGTTGQVLVGNTGGAPSWATLTGIGVTSFSGGTTGLTPASPTTGAITLAGTLGVANGGTGTATAFTAGSVVFAGASGVYSQDNANLFWDDTNNRLGIGTATPGARLETSVTSAGATAEVLRLSNPGAGANTQAQINFATTSTSYATITGGYGAAAPQMTFNLPSATAGNYIWQITGTERMRLDAAGNVGIGTTSPANRLQVSYTSTAPSLSSDAGSGLSLVGSSTLRVNIGSDPSFPFGGWIQASNGSGSSFPLTLNPLGGNIGIGTSSPTTKLEISGIGEQTLRITSIIDGTAATPRGSFLSYRSGSGEIETARISSFNRFANLFGANLEFAVLDASQVMQTRMAIDRDGNVGIGTSSPGARLDVRTSLSATAGVQNIADFYPITSGNTDATYGGRITLFTKNLNGNYWPAAIAALNDAGGSNLSSLGFYTATAGQTLNERMRIDSSGNVGIGTSSPSARLDLGAYTGPALATSMLKMQDGWHDVITAGAVVGSRYYYGASIYGRSYADVNGFNIDTSSTSVPIIFGTAGSERMRITNAGDVGIGTASPTVPLDVFNSSGGWIRFRNSGGIGELFADGAATLLGSVNAIPLLLRTGSVEHMRITVAGDVGIGTASPGAKLDVSGGNMRVINTTATSQIIASNTGGILALGRDSSTGGSFGSAYSSNLYSDGAYPLLIWTNASERMRIDSSGNVMIGTTAANNKFLVTYANPVSVPAAGAGGHCTAFGTVGYGLATGALTNGNAYLQATRWDTIATNYDLMLQPNGGNVGIGTTTPTSKLFVEGTIQARNGSTGILIYGDGSGAGYIDSTGAGNPLILLTNGTERMRITGSGLVGIGTSPPATVLDIAANGGMVRLAGTAGNNLIQVSTGSGATGMGMWAGGNTRLYSTDGMIFSVNSTLTTGAPTGYTDAVVINSSGNVGIGTGSPTAKVQIGTTNPAFGATEVNLALTGANGVFNSSLLFASENTNFRYQNKFLVDTGALLWQNSTDGTTYTERMRIDSSGNVGIGTSSPSSFGKFAVTGTLGTVSVNDQGIALVMSRAGDNYIVAPNGNWNYSAGTHIWTNSAQTTEYMRITSAGDVGIGTSSTTGYWPSNLSQVAARAAVYYNDSTTNLDNANAGLVILNSNSTAGTSSKLVFGANNTDPVPVALAYISAFNSSRTSAYLSSSLVFGTCGTGGTGTGPTERARIDSSGNLLVGTTATGGATTNTARVTGGIFSTFNSSPSIPHNTATTVATLPSGDATYLVAAAMVGSGAPADYNETAIISVSASTAVVTTLVNAAAMSITVSGLNVQLTHNQGATQTCPVTILRVL